VARILVVAPAWVGDMVMAQSLVAKLKRGDASSIIDLVAPRGTAPLGERMPGVSETRSIAVVRGRFDMAKRLSFGRSLRNVGYDRAIVLPSSWKSALVPWAANIAQRTGYVGELRYGLLNDARRLDRKRLPRTVDRFVALAAKADEPPSPAVRPVLAYDAARARALAAALKLSTAAPIIALCPGAEFGPSKRWPAAHFSALAARLARHGYAIWLHGSPKEAALCEEIRTLTARRDKDAVVASLAGRSTLVDAIDLLSLATAVVSNDSGLMHVAAAIGRPLVALYGPTNIAANPPLTDAVAILERTLPCRPCWQPVCPLRHHDCLNLIRAEEVAEQTLAQVAAAA
jgi:heptosyltransferase-2